MFFKNRLNFKYNYDWSTSIIYITYYSPGKFKIVQTLAVLTKRLRVGALTDGIKYKASNFNRLYQKL
jgi:hypothetical protein